LYFSKTNCTICKVVHLVTILCTLFFKVYIYN
jgi:hypothetical protein